MRVKTVYLNDFAIGQASSWAEVNALLRASRVRFLDKPGAAEGPTGFYVHATLVKPLARQSNANEGVG